MREEREHVQGDQVIDDALDLWGGILGNVTVVDGGKLYVRGTVFGELLVEEGGRVHIYGNVTRDVVVMEGAKVIHSGVIGGDAINRGGRLFIEAGSTVMGKVRRKAGETHVSPRARVQD